MRVAVPLSYFQFFPEIRQELLDRYPDTNFLKGRGLPQGEELIDFLKGAEVAVIGLNRFTDDVCRALPDLKIVSLCSAGVDHVDPAILNRHGIRMWWAAGINKVSVSELAVCYMVLALRRVHELSSVLRAGNWRGPMGFGLDLRGRTVGVHGIGHIGQEVVRLLQAYGVEVLACDREDRSEFCAQFANVRQVGLDEMLARSEVVTIHLSKNSSTIGMYSAALLDQLRPGVILVNCARGGMVDEAALAERLKDGRIAGAAFDVFNMEPATGHPLLELPNFFGSPHIGATTRESWGAMLRSGIYGIEHAYRPEPGVFPFD